MLTNERKETVLALCRAMIQAKSYSGGEQAMAEVMRDFCTQQHIRGVETDRYGNCICHIPGSRPGPKVLLDGHMDTVPVPDPSKWTVPPFAGEVRDGRVYGRGASDMKGALAAMLSAACFYTRDCGGNFPGDIYVAGIVHEECFEGVAAREVSRRVRPDVVVIGEASMLNVKIGQRGRAEIVVETFGVPAHSANPEKGVNAVYQMCRVIEAIRRLTPPRHPVLGDGILELTDIKSSPYPGASVVPDHCRATYDRRLLPGETQESVLAPIQALLAEMSAADPTLRAAASLAAGEERCYTGETIAGKRFFPGWLQNRESPFIQNVVGALQARGYAPEITQYNFCTNGSHYAGEAGIPTLGIGPSRENLAHTVDEYIELSQLYGAADCYGSVLDTLLRKRG